MPTMPITIQSYKNFFIVMRNFLSYLPLYPCHADSICHISVAQSISVTQITKEEKNKNKTEKE